MKQQQLRNGMPLVVHSQPGTRCASISLGFRGGWSNDPMGQFGLTRLSGLSLNLYDRPDPKSKLLNTSYAHDRNRTRFSFQFPVEWTETVGKWVRESFRAPRVEGPLLENALGDFASLLSIILDPELPEQLEAKAFQFEYLLTKAWPGHPVSRSSVDEHRNRALMKELQEIALEDLQAEARRWIDPNRMVIGISGPEDLGGLDAWAEEAFGTTETQDQAVDLTETSAPRTGFADVVVLPSTDNNPRQSALLYAVPVPMDEGPGTLTAISALSLAAMKLQMTAVADGLPIQFYPFTMQTGTRSMAALSIETPDPDVLRMGLALVSGVRRELEAVSKQDRMIVSEAMPWMHEAQAPRDGAHIVTRAVDAVLRGTAPQTPIEQRDILAAMNPEAVAQRAVQLLSDPEAIHLAFAGKRVRKVVEQLIKPGQ